MLKAKSLLLCPWCKLLVCFVVKLLKGKIKNNQSKKFKVKGNRKIMFNG